MDYNYLPSAAPGHFVRLHMMKMARNQKPEHPTEPKSFITPKINPTPNWRIQIKQSQLVSQASTIILQRHSKYWAPLLRPFKLSANFTPFLFHQILSKIQTHPKICFTFFKWAQKALDFKPDPTAEVRMIRILFGSGLSESGKRILNSFVQDRPSAKIVPLLIKSCPIADCKFISPVLNSVIVFYCSRQMYLQSLEIYRMGKRYGFELSVDTCNALLNLLCDKNELKLAWSFYSSSLRNGVLGDEFTWLLIARVLHKDDKFERISRILNMGMCNPEMFDLMIDGYSKRGDFVTAFDYLNELSCKRIHPSFCTYSSILDGACKYRNREVIENIASVIVQKGDVPEFTDYNLIIQKLCDMKRTFAVDLFFKMAQDEKIELRDATYKRMLTALSSEKGRIHDAIELYNAMQEKNITPSENCYDELVTVLCDENPSRKVSDLLVDIIGRRGFVSSATQLSTFVAKQCAQGRWREAEQLFDSITSRGCLLDSVCCGSFMKYYCFRRRIDKAITMHDKLKELGGTVDVGTYNILLDALLNEKRIEEAIDVFDYMRTFKLLNGESFSLVIRGLCYEKEMKKAMKLHDEMLESGVKPDQRTYKRLIKCFG